MQGFSKFNPGASQGYQNENDDYYGTEDSEDNAMLNTMNLPVRQHHNKLEDILNEYLKELNEIKKKMQLARIKMVANEGSSRDWEDELQTDVRGEILKVEKEFKKLVEADKAEMAHLKEQVQQLKQERIKITQNTVILESRTTEAENEVGFLLMQKPRGFSPTNYS